MGMPERTYDVEIKFNAGNDRVKRFHVPGCAFDAICELGTLEDTRGMFGITDIGQKTFIFPLSTVASIEIKEHE